MFGDFYKEINTQEKRKDRKRKAHNRNRSEKRQGINKIHEIKPYRKCGLVLLHEEIIPVKSWIQQLINLWQTFSLVPGIKGVAFIKEEKEAEKNGVEY